MPVPTAVMLDTIGANASHIPVTTHYVGAYVTGIGDVPWSAADIARFPHSKLVRIAQGAGPTPTVHGYDVLDVESRAITPAHAANMVAERVAAGIKWTTVYGSSDTLSQVTEAIKAMRGGIWDGHVNYWLADWNLNETTAAAVLGTLVHGASCVGVQWASPESNPTTITPGGTATLRDTNVDISVVDANWVPSGGFTGNLPAPVPQSVRHGLVVTPDSHGQLSAIAVSTTDSVHWQ